MFRTWLLSFAVVFTLIFTMRVSAENWPGWRGPRGDGSSEEATVPTSWNGKTSENIAWKTELPGWGHSSPIVWEDRVFAVACDEENQQRLLMSFDAKLGKMLWKETVLESPLEKKHKLNSFASATPVTDGKLVYVSFLEADFGSNKTRTPGDMVVAAYDFAGKQRWLVRPGRFASVHGYCSSPILFEDMLIVNGDHDGDSYIIALDQATGKERWRIARDHKTRSYVTPIIREIDGRTQMILSGSRHVASYDPRTGKEHWRIDGPTEQFVASLVYDGELLYLTAGFPEHHILAIRPDGKGDVTDSHIVWRTTKGASYVPSPIVIDNHFLIVSDSGVASCFVGKTGERLWMERLGKHYSGSIVSAGKLAYFTADDGVTKVVKPGAELNVLHENELGEDCFSSPAISNGRIFIRGEKHLFCIATES